MILSIIVAAAENNVIGRDNALIWHVSNDLKHFRQLTTAHTIIMGRRTFESIGKALPNRRNIVISRNPEFKAAACELVDSIDKALELVKGEEEVFIIGGGAIYHEMWDKADRIYLTQVHTTVEGDTFIPAIDSNKWEETSRQYFVACEKDDFDYSFINFQRRK